MRNKLGGLFHRSNCDTCAPTTCSDTHRAHKSSCDDGCKPKFWNWQPACHAPKTCAPTCTDSCGHGSFNILSNLRHRFAKNECCDGGCASTSAPVTSVAPPAKSGEKIEAPAKKLPAEPKKLPVEPKKVVEKKPAEEVRIEPAPVPAQIAPNVVAPLPAPPAVDITPVPVPVPRVDGDRRDPF